MPVDPKGTAPGLAKSNEEPEQVHMSCKNKDCDSILAVEMKIPGQSASSRLYQCVKCKMTRSIPVGGAVNL
jgi:hypothetical protein